MIPGRKRVLHWRDGVESKSCTCGIVGRGLVRGYLAIQTGLMLPDEAAEHVNRKRGRAYCNDKQHRISRAPQYKVVDRRSLDPS